MLSAYRIFAIFNVVVFGMRRCSFWY